ncbi:MAG: DMT family transporter [Methanobacteriota archaeon]
MELLVVLLALGATLCWGMDQVLGKFVLRDLDVLTFNALRPAFAMIFVIPYALFFGQLSYGAIELIALVAFAGFIAEFLGVELYFYIIKRSTAHLVIPVGNSDPLWAALGAILLLSEEASSIVFISIAFVIIGTFFLSQESGWGLKQRWWKGVILAAFVAFLWGISMPITKYCLDSGMSMATAQTVRVTVSLFCCSALMFAKRPSMKVKASVRTLKLTLLSGFLAYFLGFMLWLQAMNMESANAIAPFLGGKAVFGFLFAILILREKFTKRSVLGMLSILLGMLLVSI